MHLIEIWNSINWVKGIGFVALVSGMWMVAGQLKSRGILSIGDSRKMNHATVLAGGSMWFTGSNQFAMRSTCYVAVGILFGLLLVACRYPRSFPLKYAYIGYARESDEPHAAFHIWFSWLVSIFGLVLVDVMFGNFLLTRVASLVLGVADAVAEPIGSRFGVHRYLVNDVLTSTPRFRSVEGSTAVAVATFVVVLGSCGAVIPGDQLILWGLAAALLITLVEAYTPHGLDNLTIPVSAAWLLQSIIR